MNEPSEQNKGNLVPAGGRDLAAATDTNPLVTRGIADLAGARAPPPPAEPAQPAKADNLCPYCRGADIRCPICQPD